LPALSVGLESALVAARSITNPQGNAMSDHRGQKFQDNGVGRTRGIRFLPALGAGLLVGLSLYASRAAVRPEAEPIRPARPGPDAKGDDKPTARAVAAANAFLESLDAKQRAKVVLPFDSPKKAGWSNLPVTLVPRNGIPLGDLTKKQRTAALATLAAVLSKQGYQKVLDVMNADDQLVKGKGNKMRFGTDNFYLALFGKPSPTQPWMVQFGGHHLGLNVTLVGKDAVLTPTHTGAQPVLFLRDGKEVRPLGPENDLAFKLVNQLDARQRAVAVRGAKPRNLVLGPGQDDKTVAPEGIKGPALSKEQRGLLLELIGAWVRMLPDDAAARRLAEIKGQLADTSFAWYGPTAAGSAAYYRIQGPSVVIEYAPQGGTNHIHTVIRNPKNDYGKALTKP
jgi:hypothetical protein